MKKIMWAADKVNARDAYSIASALSREPAFGGVKIGIGLALRYGLKDVVGWMRNAIGNKGEVIYDHQKAGNDIPVTGEEYAEIMQESGVDGAILFPFTGPATEMEWISRLQLKKVKAIVGGAMTHQDFEKSIPETVSRSIYRIAAHMGVENFVVPGNKPEVARNMIAVVRECWQYSADQPTFYSPGLITQGGDITEAGELCGPNFVAIIGSAITDAPDALTAYRIMAEKL